MWNADAEWGYGQVRVWVRIRIALGIGLGFGLGFASTALFYNLIKSVINAFGVKGDSGWYMTDLNNFNRWNSLPLYCMHVAINKK